LSLINYKGIGDWGLGIGPIPNPQSPIPNILKKLNLFENHINDKEIL